MNKDMTPLLGYRLKLAQHALHRRMEGALRPFGLNPAQYAALAELNVRPDQTNADLAVRAFITPQSMLGVLAKLEGSGLVERRQDTRHGRRQLACLTPDGYVKAEAANAAMMRVEDALETAVHPDTLEAAVDLMDRLKNAMCE